MRPQLPSSSWMPAGAGRQPQRTGQNQGLEDRERVLRRQLESLIIVSGPHLGTQPLLPSALSSRGGGRVNYKESPRSKSNSDATGLGWKSLKDFNVFFFFMILKIIHFWHTFGKQRKAK